MAPVLQFRIEYGERPVTAAAATGVAWMNQATRCHCHFGLKSAPQHRDFRPGKEEVS
jgi:hypothetical protein